MKVSIFCSGLLLVLYYSVKAFKGVSVCRQDCEQRKGCAGVHFDPVHLQCRLLFDRKFVVAVPPAVVLVVLKGTDMKGFLKKCSANDRLIVNKLHNHVCVGTEVVDADVGVETEVKAEVEVKAKGDYSSLLVLTSKLYQLDLKTFVVHPVPPPWRIYSLAYLKKEKRLVLGLSDQLVSTSVAMRKRKRIKLGLRALEILVDEAENLLFARTLSESQWLIHTMTLNGDDFKCIIVNPADAPAHMDIDVKNKWIYFLKEGELVAQTYDGNVTNFSAISVDSIVYDPLQGVLFVSRGSNIVRISITGSATKIGDISEVDDVSANSMKILGKYLYVSVKGRMEIIVMDVTDPLRLRNVQLGDSDREEIHPVQMCFI